MASIFKRIENEAATAAKAVDRLSAGIPGRVNFAGGGGGAGMPSSVVRDIAQMTGDLRRIRTRFASSPDDFMTASFLQTKTR